MGRRSWEWPKHEEVLTTALLLGENTPVICSSCLGRHVSQGLFQMHTCAQCHGCGYDFIGPLTAQAMKYKASEIPSYLGMKYRADGVLSDD